MFGLRKLGTEVFNAISRCNLSFPEYFVLTFFGTSTSIVSPMETGTANRKQELMETGSAPFPMERGPASSDNQESFFRLSNYGSYKRTDFACLITAFSVP